MATKKAQSKAPAKAAAVSAPVATSSSANTDFWKWLYVAGVVVACLASALKFTAADPYLAWVLALIGVLVAIFYFDTSDFMNFGLRYLIVLAVAGVAPLGGVPAVGGFISGFISGFATFLGPIVLTMAVLYFWKKYFGSM
jgi:hypothetical protein